MTEFILFILFSVIGGWICCRADSPSYKLADFWTGSFTAPLVYAPYMPLTTTKVMWQNPLAMQRHALLACIPAEVNFVTTVVDPTEFDYGRQPAELI